MIQALLKYVILFWQGLLKTHNATVKLTYYSIYQARLFY